MDTPQRTLSALSIDLHGRHIGTILRLAGDRQVFAFEQSYIDDPQRPTLSLSFKGQTGELRTDLQQVTRRVPAFFSNLLPEGHLRSYLAEQAGVNPEREFFLLAALGEDLAGAVTAIPRDADGQNRSNESTLDEKNRHSPADLRTRRTLRFSLAGVQLKFSAIMESHGGLTIPAQGIGGSWIVKLPSMNFASVSENEFVMLDLARSVGIVVPRNHLVPVKDIEGLPPDASRLPGNALAVERFDRSPDGTRIHMEDFAQVFGLFPENKYKSVSYANIARVLWAETGEVGTYEFIRRITFSVLIGNADMHLKNWSLLYPDTRSPVLSPAYDFVSTLPYIPNDTLALTLGGSRDLTQISFHQIRRLTDKAGLPMAPVLRIVRETTEATVEAWRNLPTKHLLPAAIREVISAQIDKAASKTRTALGE
jgi:serine/threonine-protein kinase HipA